MLEEIEIIDIGAATELTKGTTTPILMELGTPPFAWQMLPPFPG